MESMASCLMVLILAPIVLVGIMLSEGVSWKTLLRVIVVIAMLYTLLGVTIVAPHVRIRRIPVGPDARFKEEHVVERFGNQFRMIKPPEMEENERAEYFIKVDSAHLLAEYALIIAIATFLLQVLPRATGSLNLPSGESPTLSLQPAPRAETLASNTAYRELGPDMFGKES